MDVLPGGAGVSLPELIVLDHFPDHLLEVEAAHLWQHLAGPTLFKVAGRQPHPLFVTVLLHGNEITGWQAVQEVMRSYQGKVLPRSLLLFVGNVEEAKANVRTLPLQLDYNRAWPGTRFPDAPEASLMQRVVDVVKEATPFASIDVHNNTGHNPLYGCVNKLDDEDLHLARLFSRTIVFFERPRGVQSIALSQICPAVTIECGQVGTVGVIEKAASFIKSALQLTTFPEHPLPDQDIELIKTSAIVKVPVEAQFSFDGSEADFCFRADLEQLNFSPLAPGTVWGRLSDGCEHRLDVSVDEDSDGDKTYFDYHNGEIRLRHEVIPAMITHNQDAVRSDCLCYLMRPIDRHGRELDRD